MSNILVLRRWRKPKPVNIPTAPFVPEPCNRGFIEDAIRRVNAARERERAAERERAREARRVARERVELIERKVSPISEYRRPAAPVPAPYEGRAHPDPDVAEGLGLNKKIPSALSRPWPLGNRHSEMLKWAKRRFGGYLARRRKKGEKVRVLKRPYCVGAVRAVLELNGVRVRVFFLESKGAWRKA